MLRDDPKDAFLNYALALERMKKGEMHEAIQALEKLRDSQPDYLATYYQLGKLYEQVSQNSKALSAYESGLEIAKKQGDNKAVNEINEAIWLLD
ncbi:MAG: tetratricopeptide repeat protein [Flavobacteriales bacterium]|nr:tetratricopeptide repeat protein [Flavobacteriales bacterium]